MATMPTQAEYAAQLFSRQAGKQLTRDYLQKTVPENTSVMVVALSVAEGTEDAVLAAIDGHGSVNTCLEVGRRRTPDWTPEGQEWEVRAEMIGGHRMKPEPEPE